MRAAVPLMVGAFLAALYMAALVAPPVVAQQVAPPTLNGELRELLMAVDAEPDFCAPIDFLDPDGDQFCYSATSVDATVNCDAGTASFTVEGAAAGPYPGTFTEEGTITFEVANPTTGFDVNVTGLEAEFRIDSLTGVVTGTKTFDSPSGAVGDYCVSEEEFRFGGTALLSYEAEIETPLGRYRDEGISVLSLVKDTGADGQPYELFREPFISSLDRPVALLPTTREACQGGGHKLFPGFKNQGDCVSFVATEGKNEPGRNQPGTSP